MATLQLLQMPSGLRLLIAQSPLVGVDLLFKLVPCCFRLTLELLLAFLAVLFKVLIERFIELCQVANLR